VISLSSTAQNYLISNYNNQTISTCSGTFYDSGGNGGNYAGGESYVVTIAPATTGNAANISFTTFTVGIGDVLEVFDGPNVNSTLLNIYSNGNSPVGITIRPSLFNYTQSITLRWTSTTSNIGWSANLTCGTPCQNFTATLASSTPPFVMDSGVYIIDVCQGDSVTMTASANFPFNNLYYAQDSTTTNFAWTFTGTNTTINGQQITSQFNNPQGYNVSINATDTNACPSYQSAEIRIRFSTSPHFNGTHAMDTIICQEDTTVLNGMVTTTPWIIVPSMSVAGTTYLPDGVGVSYTSNLVFSGFNQGQTLQQASDILKVFAEMEHSYLGDLNITLGCPNGSSVVLKSYPNGGNCFMGEPIDNNATQTAGLGYMYHWETGGTTTMLNAINTYTHNFTDVLGNTYTNQAYLPPSTAYPATSTASAPFPQVTYLPETPFTNLVGCPLNGAWTLTVTDNLAIDNGFIFSWGIDFDPAILPVSWGYEPTVDTTFWTSGGGDTTDFIALSGGSQTLTYTMVDNAGCSYDTNVTIHVTPGPAVDLGNDTSICINDNIIIQSGVTIPNVSYNWSTGGTNDTISVQPNTTSSYSLEAVSIDGCKSRDTIEIVVNPLPTIQISNDTMICIGSSVDIEVSGGNQYAWNTGYAGSTYQVNPTTSTLYVVTVTDTNACQNTDSSEITVAPLPNIVLSNDTVVCDGTSAQISASGGILYMWSNGVSTSSQTVSPVDDENYMVHVIDANNCEDSASILVEVLEIPEIEIATEYDTICAGEKISLTASGAMYYFWNAINGSTITPSPIEPTRYHVTGYNELNGTRCTDTASYPIFVERCVIYVPSAFTPNDDGLNEEFGPVGIVSGTASYEFIIFDRWGRIVFETNDLYELWDGDIKGEPAPEGVYSYVIRVGNTALPPYELIGTVTLLR
jgi:gliding motility-associated-like protein